MTKQSFNGALAVVRAMFLETTIDPEEALRRALLWEAADPARDANEYLRLLRGSYQYCMAHNIEPFVWTKGLLASMIRERVEALLG